MKRFLEELFWEVLLFITIILLVSGILKLI